MESRTRKIAQLLRALAFFLPLWIPGVHLVHIHDADKTLTDKINMKGNIFKDMESTGKDTY